MKTRLNKDGAIALLAPFRWTIVMGVCFFLAAGRTDVFRAWLFFGIYLTGAIVGAVIMWKFAPDLANQRGFIKQGTKSWDKVFLAVYFSVGLVIFPVVAGLDVGRYRWSLLGIKSPSQKKPTRKYFSSR